MARPNKGLGHIDTLQGGEEDKWQLKVILGTLTQELLVEEAYEELGVGPTQFAHLRRRVLQGALDALQPRPMGRPRREPVVSDEEVRTLRRRIAELERDATVLRSRLELSVLPLLGGPKRPKRGSRGHAPDPGPRSTVAE